MSAGVAGAAEGGWWYRGVTGKTGPFSPEQLLQLVASGAVKDGTMVWQKEFGAYWKPFSATDLWRPVAPSSAPPSANEKWEETFRLVEEKISGRKLKFGERRKLYSYAAFVMGPFYYFWKGMYAKGFVIFALTSLLFCFLQIVQFAAAVSFPDSALSFLPGLFCATHAYEDFYLKEVQGKAMWSRFKWLDAGWKAASAMVLSFVLLCAIATALPSPNDILKDMSGVWKTDAGTIVRLSFGERQKTIAFGGKVIPVRVYSSDTSNEIVVLKPTVSGVKFTTITLRRDWNEDHSRFGAYISIDDGDSDHMSYVRPN